LWKRRRRKEWVLGPRRSFPPPQQQAHHNNITQNPKTTTSQIKNLKTKLFHELPWVIYEKKIMESKERRRGAYHSMAHPNNIKGRGKRSSLIANTKPQAFRIWISLGEEEKRKRTSCKCKIWIVRIREGFMIFTILLFIPRIFPSTPTPSHKLRFICLSPNLLKLTKHTQT